MNRLIVVVMIGLVCCTSKNRLIPDNVFKYSEVKLIKKAVLSEDYDEIARTYSLKSLNDAQMKVFTDPLFGHERYYNPPSGASVRLCR